ncbi:NAC domain-containing protein 83-like isoform X2 [Panicum miliaceum]|uniref:NAC domain-containing protein 83-like isoform X2 n=1 Tax=Panicum miliaceum TaxID=4540 RepID=A0A3L6PPU2_PANMI|nr:NAC domain-containing protein 83-like isoform X2 [Panicum miliaceum]
MEGRPGGAWRMQGPAGAPVAGLPIGFRFRPTDEELLLHYLRRKALACPLPAGIIPDADLARLHPWDLLPPAGGDADGERFFFHRPATRCWRKGGGAARAAGTGVWRPSGKEKLVVSPRCKRPVGTKRTLVFYRGRGRGAARTDWAMHEYRLLPAGIHPFHGCAAAGNPTAAHVSCHGAAADWLVCRIFKRTKPAAHRGREDDDAGERPSSPSSASSCVTDTSDTGDQEHDDDEGSSSSSSNGGSSCSVASN